MLGLIKKIFIGLLTGPVNRSNHIKYVSLRNDKCMTQPTLINLILMNIVKNLTTTHLRLN